MRTSEEFENHVYGLIAEKKQRRQKRRRLLSAVLVLLVISAGFLGVPGFSKPPHPFPRKKQPLGKPLPFRL